MDQIGDLLRSAVDDSPRPGVDVDTIVAAERRTSRRRRYLGAFAAVVLVAGGTYGFALILDAGATTDGSQIGSGSTPSSTVAATRSAAAPTTPPPKRPQPKAGNVWAEPRAKAQSRLSRAVADGLEAVLNTLPANQRPEVSVLDSDGGLTMHNFVVGGAPPDGSGSLQGGYKGMLVLTDDDGATYLQVGASPAWTLGGWPPCGGDIVWMTSCSYRVLANGSVEIRYTISYGDIAKPFPGGATPDPRLLEKGVEMGLMMVTADGSVISASVKNHDPSVGLTRDMPLLTFDQLENLVQSSGVTFYP